MTLLRDTRHYYSLNITSKKDEQGNSIYERQASDESIYTHRQVTNKELAKCVGIIIADALYQSGLPKADVGGEATRNCYGASGTGLFEIKHSAWSNNVTWGFKNTEYRHVFRSGGCSADTSKIISDFWITGNNATATGLKAHKLYYLPPLDMEIYHESDLSSYKSNVYNFTAGSEGTSPSYKLYISKDGEEIVNLNKYEDFILWFPYWFDNSISATAVSTYDSAYPLYNSPWWN